MYGLLLCLHAGVNMAPLHTTMFQCLKQYEEQEIFWNVERGCTTLED